MARENARRNRLEGVMDFRTADVFDLFTQMAAEKRRDYDFIILDPPAFTKSRQTVRNAAQGIQGDQSQSDEAAPQGRLPRHLLLFPFHDRRAFP